MNIVTIDADFKDLFKTEKTDGTPVKFQHDPIAAACASYKIWKTNGQRWVDITDIVPSVEDCAMADQVRSYYRAKITWQKLRSTDQRPMSEFRRKLMGIIEGTHEITTNDQGILYRLPYFYAEDTAEDSVFEGYTPAELYGDNQHSGTYTFNLVKEIFVGRKRFESVNFWLQSKELPVPCLIVVRNDNSLLPLLRSVVNRGSVELSARLFPKWRIGPGKEGYYQLGNITLA